MILLTGSTGMLGKYIETYLELQGKEVKCLTRTDLDLSEFSEYQKLDLTGVTAVINAAGVINKLFNSKDDSKAFMVNSIWPHYLARSCYNKNIPCYHITTDCVYSGKEIIRRDSKSDALDDYGLSKSIGEPAQATVIRTSIIGEELIHKRSLIEWAKANAGQHVQGFSNHWWNGVTCLQLARILNQFLDINYAPYKTIQIGSEPINKFDLLLLINEFFNLDLKIAPLNTTEPVNRVIPTEETIGLWDKIQIPSLRTQLRHLVEYSPNLK
jgi:dTDP-4-dehydrorhamnose reductase